MLKQTWLSLYPVKYNAGLYPAWEWLAGWVTLFIMRELPWEFAMAG